MRTFRLTLPHLPPTKLNPNQLRRLCWQVRSSEMKSALGEAYYEAVSQWKGQPPMQKATANYYFHLKTWRKRDIDNLVSACKPYIDGLVQAGVISGDDCWSLSIGGASVTKDIEDKTVIEIRELNEAKVY